MIEDHVNTVLYIKYIVGLFYILRVMLDCFTY